MSYPDPNSRSAQLSKRAEQVYPGGTTRGQTYYSPYPIYVERAEGCQVFDVDGTARVDYLNNYTVQFFGHSHPDIVAAVQALCREEQCQAEDVEDDRAAHRHLLAAIQWVASIRNANVTDR